MHTEVKRKMSPGWLHPEHTTPGTWGRGERKTDRETGRQADRKTDRQAGRQTGRQAGRQTDRKKAQFSPY